MACTMSADLADAAKKLVSITIHPIMCIKARKKSSLRELHNCNNKEKKLWFIFTTNNEKCQFGNLVFKRRIPDNNSTIIW